MRTLISCFLITLLSFGLVIHEASAKRFGGGRSFGVQRSHQSLFSSQNTKKNTAFMQKTNQNKWGGMLGGLLAGGLLASLFMGHGFAGGMMSLLIIGSIIFFAIALLRKYMQPQVQSAQRNSFTQNAFNQFNPQNNSSRAVNDIENFDSEQFIRNAKVTFIRLQSAYDQKNLQDLATFTAPEVFAEIKMQLDERGDEPNTTEVINLNAELLDVSRQALSTMASVRFTGTIKENNDPISPLDEIWHFRQFDSNKEWVVGGIQQDVFVP